MNHNYLRMGVVTCLLSGLVITSNAQTGIGTLTPDASAQLDVTSNTKGILVPRMTSDQRTGIATPADGLLVYDTDTQGFWYHKTGTGWTELSSSTLTLPYTATENNAGNLFSITNDGDGTALSGVSNATSSNITAVRGEVSSTSPGGFSTGVKGVNCCWLKNPKRSSAQAALSM